MRQIYCPKKIRHLAIVVLNAYSNCDFYIINIDRTIMNLAVKSHGAYFNFDVFTIRQVEAVMQLINRKLSLLYLKLVTEQTITALPPLSRMLLKDRFICRKPIRKTAVALKLDLSIYQKKFQRAILDFGERLIRNGTDDKWFKENYFDQRWIRKLYFALLKGEKVKWIRKYIPQNR